MNAIRVLQVLDKVSYNSGVSAVVMNYCKHISKNVQIDFLLYEQPEKEWIELLERLNIQIYTSGKPTGRGIVTYQKNVEEFFRVHAENYDIVHLHIPNAAFTVLRCAKKYGIPVRIMHSHNARGADGMVKKVRNFILNKWGLLYANEYFACGLEAAKYLFGKQKVESGSVVIINNAIDLAKYSYDVEKRQSIRTKLGLNDEILLGHVGRFEEQKNHQGLIRIFKELISLDESYKLVLLGDGPLREQIECEVVQSGLAKKVIFTGIVNNVNEYLSAMDIFVLPSLYEGLPVVCVEAQAAGLPCIVSTNVTNEIRFTESVYFVEHDNIVSWCEKIRSCKSDTSVRMCKEIEEYSIQKQAKRLEGIYMSYGASTNTDVHL